MSDWLDDDGYPTDEALRRVKRWPADEPAGVLDFMRELWNFREWGWHQHGDTHHVSTGGWSGNEDLIRALQANPVCWLRLWKQARAGGHYIFHAGEHATFKWPEQEQNCGQPDELRANANTEK